MTRTTTKTTNEILTEIEQQLDTIIDNQNKMINNQVYIIELLNRIRGNTNT